MLGRQKGQWVNWEIVLNYFTDQIWEEGLSGGNHGFFIKNPRWAKPSGG